MSELRRHRHHSGGTTLEGGIRKHRRACPDCEHDVLVRFERIDVEVLEEYSGVPQRSATQAPRTADGGHSANCVDRSTESGAIPDPSAVVEDRHVDEEGGYGRTDCGAVESRVTQLSIDAECREGSVTVEAIIDADEWAGVRLGWNAGSVVVGTDLDCASAGADPAGRGQPHRVRRGFALGDRRRLCLAGQRAGRTGLTQGQVGEAAGVTPATLRNQVETIQDLEGVTER